MKEETLVVALVQARLEWEEVPRNLLRFDERVARGARADVIVLPEMFASGFTMAGKARVSSFYGEIVAWMQGWARRCDALLVGSTVYKEGDLFFNRLVAAFPGGEVCCYDKRHRFTMGGEDQHFAAGKELLFFSYKGIKIAPFICYDLRFPVWSRNATNYDMALYVANWPASRREAWQVLLKARAIENQAYVVGVNRVGVDGNGIYHAGDSVVVSPKGNVIGAVAPDADAVAMVEVDFSALREFRGRFPVLQDRDTYQLEL
ncbi:MAG: amidohydrolase [Odoribacteraceae bacterium]|jgi:predicted amidohydrolase|nr:amidohydrolase [Odoribacteraceae bacterium]